MSMEQKWEKSKRLAQALNLTTNALVLRAENIDAAQLIATDYGLNIPGVDAWLTDVRAAQDRDRRIQATMHAIETRTLGIRDSETVPDDLDAMAQPHATQEQLVDYINFSFPILITVGVVVAVGLIAMFKYNRDKAIELDYYKPLKKKADELLCADPNSEQCQKWLGKQAELEFQAKKTTWENLEEKANQLVAGTKTGLQYAIPVVIGLVALSWLKK